MTERPWNEEPWRKDAACRTVPTNQMFPHANNHTAWAELKVMCSLCPVKQDCLDYADSIENSYRGTHGMYGGLTPAERVARRSQAKRRATACSKPGHKEGVERHHRMKTPICTACEKWQERRDADARRWAAAQHMMRQGHADYEISKSLGVHRVTLRRLRQELQSAIVSS